MDVDDGDAGLELVHLLRRITGRLDLMGSEFAAANGLHPTDLRALVHLLDARREEIPATPGWLSGKLALNSASVTALVDRLVRAGYVRRTRDNRDRRRVLLTVQDEAVRLGWAFFGGITRDMVSAMREFDGAELAVARRFLERMHDVVRADKPSDPVVRLLPLDEATTERLLTVAVHEARPADVMPPARAEWTPDTWTPATENAFREFHRSHFHGANGTVMYAVEAEGSLTGMIRMARISPDEAETGMWLGRSARGKGIGTAALRALLAEAAAAGVRTIVADTSTGNAAALGALRTCGATLTHHGDDVRAELPIG
ncbi:GNAT family N-acetyltransferase [Actinokineospora auranticolor]|uniref:RimJ/RimL family protein N-acetyltransferase n=1 Tax=Actinokineospora auranticolor TaxID=155976 RepID=A0A2S6H029_9PSEU|nr:GNAT family N-acetyltransferase [Actinokineospora auranticolor]PPK70818.1 RimJ/RimL family protein N-acetyltransferase [Actinokineospora auranticolor]